MTVVILALELVQTAVVACVVGLFARVAWRLRSVRAGGHAE